MLDALDEVIDEFLAPHQLIPHRRVGVVDFGRQFALLGPEQFEQEAPLLIVETGCCIMASSFRAMAGLRSAPTRFYRPPRDKRPPANFRKPRKRDPRRRQHLQQWPSACLMQLVKETVRCRIRVLACVVVAAMVWGCRWTTPANRGQADIAGQVGEHPGHVSAGGPDGASRSRDRGPARENLAAVAISSLEASSR